MTDFTDFTWPWTLDEFNTAMIDAGWEARHQRNLFGETVAMSWRHSKTGDTWNPNAVDADNDAAWKWYACNHTTPTPAPF